MTCKEMHTTRTNDTKTFTATEQETIETHVTSNTAYIADKKCLATFINP